MTSWALICHAQTTGSLIVRVVSEGRVPVSQAKVRLANPVETRVVGLETTSDGTLRVGNLPFAGYRFTVDAPGFERAIQTVNIVSNVPLSVEVTLKIATVRESLDVSASAALELVNPLSTGTRADLSLAGIEKLPMPAGRRGLEALLATFPGFAANANGAIHPRGAHNQMTFVVDGMPIHDQLTGAFATALEPSIISSLELYTGDIPAEFGSKVSGVAAISTPTGAGTGRRWFGAADGARGAFDTWQGGVQTGGEHGRLAYFGSLSGVVTDRFLDAVTFGNLHNRGDATRGFVRLDYQASARDTFRLNWMAGRSAFELANLPSQQAAGMNAHQRFGDQAIWGRWNRILSPTSTWETTLAWRPSVARLLPSALDTPVTAAQRRTLATLTIANRWNRVWGRHNIRAGSDVEYFPVSETFSMAITDRAFNVPARDGFNDALLAHDLTLGGRPFTFSGKAAGTLSSGFAQDLVRAGILTLSLGLRYDDYRFLVNETQWQPRLGAAVHLRRTGTVLRASYNRNFQTPPNENLLLSSSRQAGLLAPASVRKALGETAVPIRVQRENVFEAGLEQALLGRLRLTLSVYHKNSRDQQDNNNFFNTGIIFPVTLARIRVNGAEARLVLPAYHGFTGSLGATHSHAVSTPPFTGGLYIGQDALDLLSSGPFVIDHDQKLGLQANLHYAHPKHIWISTSIRYDSGLVANPSDPVEVAADPDFRDLLPLVNLDAYPARVRPRTVADLSLGYERWSENRRNWSMELQFANLTNTAALYNFQSVFVGTRLISPRAVSVRWRKHW